MRKASFFRRPTLAYLFLAPQLLITIIFFFWPAIQAFIQSVFVEDPFGVHHHFVWLGNFFELFTSAVYLKAFWVTLVFSVAVSISALVGGLFFAILTEHITKGKRVYTTLLIWPYAVAPAVAGILLRFLFDPAMGIVPYWLHLLGYNWDFNIHAGQALLLIILVAVWQQTSYNFLFYFAGLKGISKSLLEAAAMDGAGPFKRFWHIVVPLLSPITFFLLVMNMIYAFFDTFGVVQIVTQGGPANATQTLVYKVYKDGFVGLDFGSSAAQSVILMLIVAVLTILQFRFIEKKVHY